MKKKKIVILAVIIVILLVVIGVILVFQKKESKEPNDTQSTIPVSSKVQEIVTQNLKKEIHFRAEKNLEIKAKKENVSLPLVLPEAVKACRISDGQMLFQAPDGLDFLSPILAGLEEDTYQVYPYGENHLRIDKSMADGKIINFSVDKVKPEEAENVYLLSDCMAKFLNEDSTEQVEMKFPFYYLSDTEDFTSIDYGLLGKKYKISAQKEDFFNYYSDTCLYLLQDEGINSFVLLGEYTDSETKPFGIRLKFEREADNSMTVTVEKA